MRTASKHMVANLAGSRRTHPRRLRSRREGGKGAGHRVGDVHRETLEDQAHSAHEEARMVLPGIQALFGFQLIAVFNHPFFDLGATSRLLHLAALVLVGIAVGLIMAPAAYHRLVEANRISRRWIRMASRDIAWAMTALLLAISLDIYLVAMMIVTDVAVAAILATGVGGFLAWLWFARPVFERLHNRVTAAIMTGKRLTIKGWASARATEKFLKQNLS
jgi:hypothetical protein